MRNPMIQDTLVNFMDVLSEEDKDTIIRAVTLFLPDIDIHIGNLPFYNRHLIVDCLVRYDNMKDQNSKLVDKLTVDSEWINITTIQDECLIEKHIITGKIRKTEFRDTGFDKWNK